MGSDPDLSPEPVSRRDGWAVALPPVVILLACVILFTPWFFGGRNLAPFDIVNEMMLPWRGESTLPKVHNHYVTDAVTQYIPYRMFADRSFREDGFVGWNPNLFGGTAQYANTMGLYFDWTIQLHRFIEFWTAWNLGIFLQLLIAGLGMWCFLHWQKVPPPLALAGGLAYLANTQFTVWVYHRWALGAMCWLPWILLAVVAWEKLRSRRWFGLSAIALALGFLGGNLQYAAMLVVAVGCVWAGSAWDARRDDLFRDQGQRFLGFLLIGMLGAGLGAWMFDATIRSYLENSAAGHERASFGYPDGSLQPLLQSVSLLFYVLPSLAGSPQTLDLFKILRSDAFNCAFFGTIPALLAVTALFVGRIPSSARLLILAGLLLPLSPLVGIFYHRINILWVAGGIWAGALLIRDATSQFLHVWVRWTGRGGAVAIGAWILASVLLIAFRQPLSDRLTHAVLGMAKRSQFGLFDEWLARRAAGLLDYLLIWNPEQLLILFGAVLSWMALRSWAQGAPILRWMLPLGILLQLSVLWFQWTTWTPETNPYVRPALVGELREAAGQGRIHQVQPGGKLPSALLFNNVLDPVDLRITGGYDSMHPNGMNKAYPDPAEMPGATVLLQLAGHSAPAGWKFLLSSEGWEIWTNPAAVQALSWPQGSPLPVERLSSNRMTMDVPPGAHRIQIHENFHPGWEAMAENWVPVKVSRASDGSISLEIPEAVHGQVKLQFSARPPAVISWLTGIAALVVASALLLSVLPGKRCGPQIRTGMHLLL